MGWDGKGQVILVIRERREMQIQRELGLGYGSG